MTRTKIQRIFAPVAIDQSRRNLETQRTADVFALDRGARVRLSARSTQKLGDETKGTVRGRKKRRSRKNGHVENVGAVFGPDSPRVSTAFPSIDGPPSGNENFVYRVLANYSVDRRSKLFGTIVRTKGDC